MIRGIRNFIILTKLFGTLEPKLLEHLARGRAPGPGRGQDRKSRSARLRSSPTMTNRDTRRMLTIMTRVLESLGRTSVPRSRQEKPPGT